MPRAIRITGKILGLALMLASVGLTASQMLGGPISIVMVEGSSMRPAYRDGDLVLVRRTGSYETGQAVAYPSRALGAVVLHRIVSKQAGALVMQGDNNNWVDPERPTAADVIGKHWLRVPGLGGTLQFLRTPRGIATGVAATAAVAFARIAVRRRRNGKAESRRGAFGMRLASLRTPSVAIAGCAAVGILAIALGAASFVLPKREPAQLSYRHTGTFSYAANVGTGPVYQRNQITTGDPVYLKLVPSLEVSFSYRFESAVARKMNGTASLSAEIADDTGWKHTLRLQPRKGFEGDRHDMGATLDTKAAWRVIDEFERLTGVRAASYSLTILPEIHTRGTLNGQAFDAAFAPRLAFRLDRVQLRMAPAVSAPDAEDAAAEDPLRPSEAGTLPAPATPSSSVQLGPARFDVVALRSTVIAALLACLVGFALLVSRSRPRERDDETRRILRRYRQWIIPVHTALTSTAGAVPVDVTTIESLLRLADRYGRMVLHSSEGERDSFYVEDEGTLYRYRPTHVDPTHHDSAAATGHVSTESSTSRQLGERSHA